MKLASIPEGIERVLTVSAHPDDSEFYAGGTLAQLADAGAEITLVVCTDGARGGRDLDDIPATRQREQEAAASALGIARIERLGYLDGDLKPTDELRDRLIGLIRQYRPDIIFGHHPQTFFTRYGNRVQMGHSDHRASGTALLDAVYPRSASPNFSPERGAPWFPWSLFLFDCSEPDHRVDISAGFEKKLAALTAHESQQGVAGGLTRAAHHVGTFFGNEEQPAEGFVRLDLRGRR
ncbi:MAG: PIG-L family deacetylase [Pseudomonadales bacterium]|nr:PIG-L family deacetylase [Pseudomonadales bacterium]